MHIFKSLFTGVVYILIHGIGIYGLQGVLLKCETMVMILAHVVSFSRLSYALKQSAQGNIPSVNVYICIKMTSRDVIDS